MNGPPDSLSAFHPILAEWFLRRVGRPTGVQAEAWPRIAAGEHVLVAAPTGSGKTMTPSVCGLGLDAIRGTLPKRLPGTHLVYRGAELVVISKRNAKDLTFRIDPGDADLGDCLAFLRHLLTRQFQPLSRITIETINGRHAAESEYVDPMRRLFDVAIDFRHVIVYPRMV